MAGPGEVQDPRVKALLLGGGAAAAGAPFVASAMGLGQKPKRQPRPKPNRLAQATPAAGRGILSTLGRFAGPVGALTTALMPTELGDATMDPVLKRQMFSGQTPNADGQGITSGLDTSPEQEAQMEEVMGDMSGMMQSMAEGIDNASDYAGIMNAIRGDEQSIDQRRGELAQLIGKSDAEKTPESALTLIQPSLTLLEATDQGSPDTPEPIMDEGILSALGKAGEQGEALARMEMGEQPVMRAAGSPPEGETTITPGTDKFGIMQKLLEQVPAAKTQADFLPMYEDLYKDSAKAYELNPFIAGLNLAAAVANAPEGELISSVLAPGTIKAVSDPILEMAKAKGQGELLAKKAAIEAAQKSTAAETSAKQAIQTAAIPQLLKGGNFDIIEKGGKAYRLNKDTGEYTDLGGSTKFKSHTMPDGRVALYDERDPTKVTYLGDKKGENIFSSVLVPGGGALVTNKQTGHVDYKPLDNMPVNYTVHGNKEGGFFRMDQAGNVTPLTETQTGVKTGPAPTDLVKNIEFLNESRTKLAGLIEANTPTTNQDYINTKSTVETLAAELTPIKGSEFERLLTERTQGVYNATQGSAEAKQQAADKFRMAAIDKYITAKQTVSQQYNPNEAIDKEFAELYGTQIKGIQEGAASAQQLAGLSEQATIAAERFQTGAFAETRLSLLKMADALGGRDKLKSLMGESSYNSVFDPANNDVPSGELLKSVGARFAVMLAEAFPGNLNQSEVELIRTAGSNIGVSREGLGVLQKAFEKAAARAVREQEYAINFAKNEEYRSLSPEAKYAKFNEGLAEIRSQNAVITQDDISGAEQVAETAAAGSINVVDTSGAAFTLPPAEAILFEQVKQYPTKAAFLADWPNIKAANPTIATLDPSAGYDTLFPLSRQ